MYTCMHKNLLPFLLVTGLLIRMQPAAGQPAQAPGKLNAAEKKELRTKEDSLQHFSDQLVNAEDPAERLRSDSQFVRPLVRSLKVKNSFYSPFDSLQTISRLYSPDSTFRI